MNKSEYILLHLCKFPLFFGCFTIALMMMRLFTKLCIIFLFVMIMILTALTFTIITTFYSCLKAFTVFF